MERWITVLLTTFLGLELGLVLLGWKRGREPSGSESDEETRPWRAVSPQAMAGVFTVASLLALAVLALAGPILAVAAGTLLFEVAILILQALRSRRDGVSHQGVSLQPPDVFVGNPGRTGSGWNQGNDIEHTILLFSQEAFSGKPIGKPVRPFPDHGSNSRISNHCKRPGPPGRLHASLCRNF